MSQAAGECSWLHSPVSKLASLGQMQKEEYTLQEREVKEEFEKALGKVLQTQGAVQGRTDINRCPCPVAGSKGPHFYSNKLDL